MLAVLQRKEEAHAGVGGPMQENAEKQLMFDKEGDKVLAEDFEPIDSFVADSGGQSDSEANELGSHLGLHVSASGGKGQGVELEAISVFKSGGPIECGLADEHPIL